MDIVGTPETDELFDQAAKASSAAKDREGAIARMDVFVEWLVTPKALRNPTTKKALAALLDVSSETLRRYETDPWLKTEFLRRSRAAFTVARASDVLETLYTRAMDPNDPQGVTAARTLMSFFEAADKHEGAESVDLSSMTNDELVELALRVAGTK